MKFLRLLIIPVFLFGACTSEENTEYLEFDCDLEQVEKGKFISTTGFELSGGHFKSDRVARSGKYSVRLDTDTKKALVGKIGNLKIGDELSISIWRYFDENAWGNSKELNEGMLSVQIGHKLFFKEVKAVKKEGDWELLEVNVTIPNEIKGHTLSWKVTYNNANEVFFDDFSLKLKRSKGLVLNQHPALPRINLELSQEKIDKLEKKRKEALENGVLVSNSDDWVKTKISWGDKKKKGKIRLKGDWTDHLYGQKYSLRVNVSKGKTLNDYSKFSIQNPASRHYLDEWFVHKILIEEGILTTRFEFADIYINEESIGLYAIEEHFTPQLLRSQGRKNGPIFKYSEDDLWYSRHINKRKAIRHVPWYQGSVIEVFSQDEIIADPNLIGDFYKGRELMSHYKFKNGDPATIVNLEKMASYIAMMDLCAGYHSLIWHNQRFYFNEADKILEPLVYDIFQENSRIKKEKTPFLGLIYSQNPNSYLVNSIDFLFQNDEFITFYIHYLEKYSDPSYFETMLEEFEDELSLFEREINLEYDFYSFNLDLYEQRAEGVRNNIEEFKDRIQELLGQKNKPFYGTFRVKTDYDPVKNVSLHAYINFLSGRSELQVQSFYYKTLEIIGVVENKETIFWEQSIALPEYPTTVEPQTILIPIQGIPESIIFKYAESDSLFTQKVKPYHAP